MNASFARCIDRFRPEPEVVIIGFGGGRLIRRDMLEASGQFSVYGRVFMQSLLLAAWRSGSVVRRMNAVALR